MSLKKKKAEKKISPEESLRNYLLKKYSNQHLDVVDKEKVEKTIRKYNETVSKRSILK